MKKAAIIYFISMMLINYSFAQDKLVNNAELRESEFHVAINPIDSNNIILATMYGPISTSLLTIYYTHDCGQSWNTSEFRGNFIKGNAAADPVLSFGSEGNVYMANLAVDAIGQIPTILSRSQNGGETWEFITQLSPFSDKPWLAVDSYNSSPFNGNAYTPVLGPTDGIEFYTFNPNTNNTSFISIEDGGYVLPSVAVKKNGDVFVGTLGVDNGIGIYISQIINGGTEIVHTTLATSFTEKDAPDISDRFQPTAYIAIDNSGGLFDGRIYLSYTAPETENSNFFDIFLTYSDDDGLTWSTPSPVHTDTTPNEQQFYSSIYVNEDGVVLLDWYDRRNFTAPDKNTDFYLGISKDGGESFQDVKLSSESMDFDHMINVSGGFGIGEYHQLVATKSTVFSFWADGRTNDEDINIYMAKVDLNNPTVSVKEVGLVNRNISISPIYPNPIKNVLNFEIELQKSSQLEFSIFDNHGKKVWRSDSNKYGQGKHQLNHECNLSSGTYFFQIKSDNGFVRSIKFIKV